MIGEATVAELEAGREAGRVGQWLLVLGRWIHLADADAELATYLVDRVAAERDRRRRRGIPDLPYPLIPLGWDLPEGES